MKPCRDCGQPTSPAARSCPSCGILNPVNQWVSYPDGSHETAREPVGPRRPAPGGFGSPVPAGMGASAAAAAMMPKKPAPSKGIAQYFAPIHGEEEARDAVRGVSTGFFVLAGLQALAGFTILPAMLVDAVLNAVLAFCLRQFASRVAAVTLLALSALGVLHTVAALAGKVEGGRNLWLAVFCVAAAYRAVTATFALHRLRTTTALA